MFQNGQRVCFKNGGDPARIQKVQLAYGKDRSRAPQVIPTTDTNATQVQIVTGEDAARYPFIDPIGLIGAPAAWFRADTGVTVTGLGASTWADQSGNGRDLLQSTDASRPPYLSYSGTKYLYLPGVANNNATTPDAPANSITGSIDLIARLSLVDWTPTAQTEVISKDDAGANICYTFGITTTGALRFFYTTDGTTTAGRIATSSATNTFSDGDTAWIRVTYNASTGKANFYTAADLDTEPSNWTAIGVEQTITSGAIFNGTNALSVGSRGSGNNPASGKIYRAIIKNGIDGTTVVDFNPDLDASDASTSFASSATGETWTVNSSGGLPAQIVGRSSILFDGVADYLKTSAFTLNQPETVYLAFKQVSWTLNDWISDGDATNGGAIYQSATTPRFVIRTGATAINENANLAVGTYGVVAAVYNGASSLSQVNLTTPVTGNSGSGNMGGFTLGAAGGATNHSNIQVLEVIIAAAAHSAEQRARVIQYLSGRHGIAL